MHMPTMIAGKAFYFLGLAVVAVISFFIGRVHVAGELEDYASKEEHQAPGSYAFISPLLQCEENQAHFLKDLRGIQEKAERVIAYAEKEGEAKKVAVYFRDLSNGPWFGIKEKEQFLPASLSKVPFLIAFLKLAEGNPSVLRERLTFGVATADSIQNYPASAELQVGKSYTVEELLRRMIVFSDNNAVDLLYGSRFADREVFDGVYSDLSIAPPNNEHYSLDIRTYASFFRILFNATYLSKPLSESALGLLTQTKFADGLRAGVPSAVPIAHKFGERTDLLTGLLQLHDCGIIYLPQRPYVLCVMTIGDDFEKLSSVIAEISRVIYKEIKER